MPTKPSSETPSGQAPYHRSDTIITVSMNSACYPVHPTDGCVKWGKVINDGLDALACLHSHIIILRDVRLDNTVWNIDHAVLIDLGTAVDLSRYRDTFICYNGGYVCCSPSIIGNPNTDYQTKPGDESLVVVLPVNIVLFPPCWHSVRSVNLLKPGLPETGDLRRFWEKIDESPVWNPFWKAATEVAYHRF